MGLFMGLKTTTLFGAVKSHGLLRLSKECTDSDMKN